MYLAKQVLLCSLLAMVKYLAPWKLRVDDIFELPISVYFGADYNVTIFKNSQPNLILLKLSGLLLTLKAEVGEHCLNKPVSTEF